MTDTQIIRLPEKPKIRIPITRLPIWPILVMFGGMPLLWVSGGFFLLWPAFGLVLLLLLVLRRERVELPSGTGVWVVFCGLVALSFTRLSGGGDLLVAGLRFAFYATAATVFVYIYATLREGQHWHRIFRPLALFWLGLVVLGWVGVLFPRLSVVSPLEAALPDNLAANPFIFDLVHLQASEFSETSANPIFRPSAPYPYTNTWGSTWAVLLPCMIAYLLSTRGRVLRVLLLVSLPLSIVPAFLTLNRAMFLSLGAGLAVLAFRGIARRQIKVIVTVILAAGLGGLTTLFIPVTQLISNRTSNSDSTVDRLSLYSQALLLAERSPLLGYGGPVTVDTTTAAAPVGTQGQFWQVLVSHGVPAALLFVGWFLLVALKLGRAVSAAGQWLATVPVIGLVQLPFYGVTFQNLSVLCFAAGLAMAAVDGPVRRPVRVFEMALTRRPTQGVL
ncbi:O-antigen ligase family protein [Actinoplanes sp. RD1]|uniref:O-antigen ligase family protein n=1 Tax=Actinoplanes sp. RD1 TaxID=3064538 RepID=UPI00274273DA|nr:O-antigen ligase family protein [Actinoplanes sp. RD1]